VPRRVTASLNQTRQSERYMPSAGGASSYTGRTTGGYSSGYSANRTAPAQTASFGRNPINIPGVSKGAQNFVGSQARRMSTVSLFKAGDRVRHGKYGEGIVLSVRGEGRDARMTIRFNDGSERTFVPDLAPVIKIG